jgi:hypothetical protein
MNNRLLEKTTSFQRAIDIPSPDNLRPTTIASLLDDCITVREIGNLFPGSRKRAFACYRAVILPDTAFSRALAAGRDRPSLSPRVLAPFRRVLQVMLAADPVG